MMERYREYKESGVKWLGEIPSHWEVVRGLGVFSENKSKNTQLENSTVLSLSYGKIIVKKDIDSGLVPEEYSSYQIVRPGCIIVRSTDLQNDKTSLRIGYVCDEGIITSAYLGLQTKGNNNDKYLYYFLHDWDITKEIYRHGNGLRQSLSWNDLRDISVLLPPLSEQDAIVRYLDSATSEIDKAIAMQQKMIDLLNERKQIIIQNAVTKGLDENVEMKESGVEWIGRIPKHWQVLNFRHLIKILTDFTANGSFGDLASNVKYLDIKDYARLVRLTDLRNDFDEEKGVWVNKSSYEYLAKSELHGGELLIANVGAYSGLPWIMPNVSFRTTLAPNMFMLKLQDVITGYIYYLLSSSMYFAHLQMVASATAQPKLNKNNIRELNIVLPPKSDQQQIVSYLDSEMQKFDTAITNCQRQITLLQERKQIIINEVVTGKVRVS